MWTFVSVQHEAGTPLGQLICFFFLVLLSPVKSPPADLGLTLPDRVQSEQSCEQTRVLQFIASKRTSTTTVQRSVQGVCASPQPKEAFLNRALKNQMSQCHVHSFNSTPKHVEFPDSWGPHELPIWDSHALALQHTLVHMHVHNNTCTLGTRVGLAAPILLRTSASVGVPLALAWTAFSSTCFLAAPFLWQARERPAPHSMPTSTTTVLGVWFATLARRSNAASISAHSRPQLRPTNSGLTPHVHGTSTQGSYLRACHSHILLLREEDRMHTERNRVDGGRCSRTLDPNTRINSGVPQLVGVLAYLNFPRNSGHFGEIGVNLPKCLL